MNKSTHELKLIRKVMSWNLNEILDKFLNDTMALKRSMNNNQCKGYHIKCFIFDTEIWSLSTLRAINVYTGFQYSTYTHQWHSVY